MSGGALFFADVFLALNVSTSPRVHPGASLSRQQLHVVELEDHARGAAKVLHGESIVYSHRPAAVRSIESFTAAGAQCTAVLVQPYE
jgi:hypothetical protein